MSKRKMGHLTWKKSARVFAQSRRASLSVSTLSELLFINKNTYVASEFEKSNVHRLIVNVGDEIKDEIEDFFV
jgi:hypothetical protein